MEVFLLFVNFIIQITLVSKGTDVNFAILSMIFLAGVFAIRKLEDIHKEIKNLKQI